MQSNLSDCFHIFYSIDQTVRHTNNHYTPDLVYCNMTMLLDDLPLLEKVSVTIILKIDQF